MKQFIILLATVILVSCGASTGEATAVDTLAVDTTTGTAPAWVSASSNTNTHTLRIPMASATGVTAGLMTKADYDRIAFKDTNNTFTSPQTFNSTGSTFLNAPFITIGSSIKILYKSRKFLF